MNSWIAYLLYALFIIVCIAGWRWEYRRSYYDNKAPEYFKRRGWGE